MTRRGPPYVLVAGSGEQTYTERARTLAYELGLELGRRRCIVVTGGLGGVMEAVCRGVKEAGGGPTVCILPGTEKSDANPFCDVVVPTGFGHARNLVNVNTADAVIVVGGAVGTLSEASFAYLAGKPVVSLATSGGVAEEIAGRRLDPRRTERVLTAENPREAVEKALAALNRRWNDL